VFELGDLLTPVPKLDVVAVYVLLGLFFGCLMIGAPKLKAVYYAAIRPYDENSIVAHRTPPDIRTVRDSQYLK
jgi:hypothetical protein